MATQIIGMVMILALMGLPVLVLCGGSAKKTRTGRGAKTSARISFLNLGAAKFESLVQEDRAALCSMFTEIASTADNVRDCEVLFLYSDVLPTGKLAGSKDSLRELTAKTGAKIVVLATANEPEANAAACQLPGSGRANFVLTADRNGREFANFFSKLFKGMLRGQTMMMAWVKLAPQGPIPAEHLPPAPATMGIYELGGLRFKNGVLQ